MLVLSSPARFGDGGDELRTPAAFDDLLSGLAILVELPMPRRACVWGVKDGVAEERIIHDYFQQSKLQIGCAMSNLIEVL